MRLLLLGGLLLAGAAHAQPKFGIGPRLGYSRSTAHYSSTSPAGVYAISSLNGFEGGLAAAISFGHLTLAPALVYTQKGFVRHAEFGRVTATSGYVADVKTQLNYLVLPLNATYSLQANGQGAQVFAGPYVGLLLGGRYDYAAVNYSSSPPTPDVYSGEVQVGDTYSSTVRGETARSLDVGVQAGVGYRFAGLLLQATYSLGLKNAAADYAQVVSPTSYNRVLQLTTTYLFGPSQL